jgi:hypothetical protein
MWMALDHEAGSVHLVRRVVENIAVDVDLHQARRGDLLIEKAVGVDEELLLGVGHPQ